MATTTKTAALLCVSILSVIPCEATAQNSDILHYLPFKRGTSFNCWQGVDQGPTHNDQWNRHAIDFSPMAVGTSVIATASGTIVWVKEDTTGPTGDWHDNNGVGVRLADGNVMEYLHFKHQGAVVEMGQKVLRGDLLGYSGDTGNAMKPHLHIGLRKGRLLGPSIPFKFVDVAGDGIPEKGKLYTSNNRSLRNLREWILVEDAIRLYGFCREANCLEALAPRLKRLRNLGAKGDRVKLAEVLEMRDQLLAKHEKAGAAALDRIKTSLAFGRELEDFLHVAHFAPEDFRGTKSERSLVSIGRTLRKHQDFKAASLQLRELKEFRRLFKRALLRETATINKQRAVGKRPRKVSWSSTRRAWKRALACAPESVRETIQRHIEGLDS